AATVLLKPWLARQKLGRIRVARRSPSVTFPQQSDEIRTRALDLGEADRQHLAALRLLGRDAPPQVHVHELDETLLQPRPERGNDLPHQQIPLGAEIAEGRRDEDADGAIFGHLSDTSI